MLDAIAKTKAVEAVRVTYVFDIEDDNLGEEKVVTDYEKPDRSRAVDDEGVTVTIGLDAYRAPALAGPYTRTVLDQPVYALSFLDELGEPSEVSKKINTYEFKTEATANALVTVIDGYVRVIQIVGKSEGYPASTSTWLLQNLNAAGIQIEPPTNLA